MAARAALVLLALLLVLAGDDELLENGGFESGIAGWRPLDMSNSATFEVDTKVKHSGKQSLRFERKGTGAADYLKAVIELPAREGRLSFSIAYQVARDSRVRVDAYFSNDKGDTIGKGFLTLVDAKPTKGFEVARADYAIPKGAAKFGINVVMDKPGTAWIDSSSVMLASDAKKAPAKKRGGNLIENGTFDTNVDGWTELANGTGTSKVSRDTAAKASGTGAFKIVRTNARLFPEDGVVATVADPGDAQQFKLTFKARVDGGAQAIVSAQAFDEDGILLATERSAVDSATFAAGTLILKPPSACARIAVGFAIRGAGSAWLDDVVLLEM